MQYEYNYSKYKDKPIRLYKLKITDMVEFLTSNFMIGFYIYLFGCILGKHLLTRYKINDPADQNDWLLSWVLVLVLIIRRK